MQTPSTPLPFSRPVLVLCALLAPLALAAAQGSDNCANAQPISGLGLFDFDNSAATTDGPLAPECAFFGNAQIARDVWFAWTAPATETFSIETCGLTLINTKIAVYASTNCPPGAPLACNDDACGSRSRILFDGVQGETYLVRIGNSPGNFGGTGQFRIHVGIFGGCPDASSGPDVIVGVLSGPQLFGSLGEMSGYAIGTTSCNVGNLGLLWISNTNEHPVIAQNLYRLENDRFEQLGQSWLKHGFSALQQEACCPCISSGSSSILGVGCSDPYSANLNGSQYYLGPRWEVNPYTGHFPYPYTSQGDIGDVLYKRLQVRTDDLSPALHPNALYYGEGHYVTPDDAAAGNQHNNASHRQIQVGNLTADGWILFFSGVTRRQRPAILAWKDQNPDVRIEEVWVPGDGKFFVASLASDNSDGTWHYEYAVFNLNVNRAAGSFQVPLPAGVTLSNVEFRGVDSHSGDPYSNDPWVVEQTAAKLRWATEDHATNPLANPLRWSTLYNFRFDADRAPVLSSGVLGLYEPGSPGLVTVAIPVPGDPGGACLATSYCESTPNSAGAGAMISHTGSMSVAANDLLLLSSGAPAHAFGTFFYGAQGTQVPFGDGYLCVAPGALGVFRLLPIQVADGAGSTQRHLDLSQPPAGGGPGLIQIGSTWHFQHWYRDVQGPGGTGFNLTDGLSVTFCP